MAGIWIRSQDKKILRNCDNIIINYTKPSEIISDLGYHEPDATNYLILGKYATEERALQVLDEIHGRINNLHVDTLSCMFFDGSFKLPQLEPAIYQMPAE